MFTQQQIGHALDCFSGELFAFIRFAHHFRWFRKHKHKTQFRLGALLFMKAKHDAQVLRGGNRNLYFRLLGKRRCRVGPNCFLVHRLISRMYEVE